MHIILGLLIGGLAALENGIWGAFLGGLIGVLAAEVLSLRKRINTLEERPEVSPVEDVVFTLPDEKSTDQPLDPFTSPPVLERETPGSQAPDSKAQIVESADPESEDSTINRLFGALGEEGGKIAAAITSFFTSGNLVLKIGVIILFFGVAFLLKYAAQRNMVPIEFRLIGVALGGIGMLAIGWRLRTRKKRYGLVMQGGGVGVLYLVVYGAAKLYGFLPLTLSLGLMIGLVGFSCMLAVLQESKSLAVFGIIGGFLAPVLMSTGGGSHVMLFSYYALLNCGILGIAWFKSWRVLNLLGFIFTFGIGALWGSSAYQPEFFSTTEPFLILFFLFYVALSVLFAHRQPLELRGFIDGPLVFGLPLVATGLQYSMVRDTEYGMALSLLFLGLYYLGLATLLWRKLTEGMRLLCEAFLALGVVFGSLAIPLALDGHWSAATWALEGAGLVWIGVRQHRVLARHFGLLLQLGAALIFLESGWYPFDPMLFANEFFLGCFFLSFGAIFSSYYLEKYYTRLKKWEHYFSLPLIVWGLLWWYIGGIREIDRQMLSVNFVVGVLLYIAASTIVIGIISRRLHWNNFRRGLLVQLPLMVLIAMYAVFDISSSSHLFANLGAVGWVVAMYVQYRMLHSFDQELPQKAVTLYHPVTLWLLLFLATHEMAWAVSRIQELSSVWAFVCFAFVPICGIFVLVKLTGGKSWPVGKMSRNYLVFGAAAPVFSLVAWLVISFSFAGSPSPLPFLPILNPIELVGLLCLVALFLWQLSLKKGGYVLNYFSATSLLRILGILLFLWLNSVVARSVHYFAGVPYYTDYLFQSVIFQAAIAALWGLGALIITVLATKKGNRPMWGVGATLLGMVVLKLFLVDLSGTGTIARIVSFLVVGVLMLIIGYFSPLPPKVEDKAS